MQLTRTITRTFNIPDDRDGWSLYDMDGANTKALMIALALVKNVDMFPDNPMTVEARMLNYMKQDDLVAFGASDTEPRMILAKLIKTIYNL